MQMEEEKRDRILNAAMKEFNKGFKNAHTDEIVHEAGISKGLLFHYFGNKENLYEFVFRYAIDVVVREYYDMINLEQRDILERMWQAILLKIDLSYKYPTMFDFLTTAYKENHNGISTQVYAQILGEAVPRLLSNIDESLFKEGIDPKLALNVIRWTQIGYSNSQLDSIDSVSIKDYQKEYERFLNEIKQYFTLFREVFYINKGDSP
jgi:AcrR family transcriptional regulator